VTTTAAPVRSTEAPRPRPTVRAPRARSAPRPKPPNFIQKIGDHEFRLLADLGRDRFGRIYTWHIGVQSPLCGASARWQPRLKREPPAYMCPKCLTALAAYPEADVKSFGVEDAFMMRLTSRGGAPTAIRAGYHTGDGRRTLCGKKDGL
jgi:hypothetical protein